MRPIWTLLPMAVLLSSVLSAQTSLQVAPSPKISPPPSLPKLSPAAWEQYAVYWTAEPGWKTEIHLRNNLPTQSLTVTPVLRTADGAESALPSVTIAPNDVAAVDLGSMIATNATPLASEFGSLVLRYTAVVPRALYAAVIIQLPGTPIEFHLDAYPKAPTAMTGGREGIWWLPRDSTKDWVVLTNTSAIPHAAEFTLYDSSGSAWGRTIKLDARQTMRISLRSLLQRAGLSGSFGGLSVDAGRRAADLDSAHFVYDETTGFLALMKMFDHNTEATLSHRTLSHSKWTIRAPMLPLSNPDPALALPADTILKPAIFLRNASAQAINAELIFHWRSGANTGKSTSAVSVQPHATKIVDVAALQADGVIPANAQWAYVSISAAIRPDDLLAVATSFDATGRLGAQTPFSDQTSNHWEGGIWEVDPTHDTLMAVGNAGSTATKARITLLYNSGQGKYQIEQALAPEEQAWVDVGKLISSQQPDVNGKTLPVGVMMGTYELNVADDIANKSNQGLFEGKLVTDKTYGYAVHGCTICCPEYDGRYVVLDPLALNLTVGGSSYQSVWSYDACTGKTVELGSSGWGTGNSQVATANGNLITAAGAGSTTDFASVRSFTTDPRGYCRWYTVLATGLVNVAQGPKITSIDPTIAMIGSTSVQITINGIGFGTSPAVNLPTGFSSSNQGSTDTRIVITVNIGFSAIVGNNSISVRAGGQTSNAVTFQVNGPSRMVVQNDRIGTTTNNPSAQSRFVTYQVYNVDGTLAVNIPIAENITLSGWNCTQHDPGNMTGQCDGTHHNNSTGAFADEWGMYTGYTPAGCGKNITDHWQWCGPAGSNPPAPTNGITFGTLTGWIHTVDSQINGYKNPPNPLPPGTVITP